MPRHIDAAIALIALSASAPAPARGQEAAPQPPPPRWKLAEDPRFAEIQERRAALNKRHREVMDRVAALKAGREGTDDIETLRKEIAILEEKLADRRARLAKALAAEKAAPAAGDDKPVPTGEPAVKPAPTVEPTEEPAPTDVP